ncbi:cell cycle checkpoint protein RAD17 [Scaptodrosophila lebanonensis]|uniref:Cell cycle checkpoint protein RAD17 n=1 Tax=Drosophila lebanonensis TaxID=7225 RepID=A0A6J2TMH3_DROLE|nr:cell cycle checkpoint protein RAD17 [Scaptodrosophila lebanonensis]
MSARKKPWVRSAFSQISITPKIDDNSTLPARTRSASAATTTRTELQTEDTIAFVDLTVNENKNETQPNSAGTPIPKDDWMGSFAPVTSEDLAVHAKKVAEVRDWFRHCEAVRKKCPAQLCLLTGPAGAGKTATVRILAEEAGYDLREWVNPVDCEVIDALGDQPRGNYVGSQLEAFKSFLLRASRYKSLLVQPRKRLLLVEDFPNVLLTDAAVLFEDIINEYVSYGKSPLVFIVADAKSRGLNISYKLFTDQLKSKFRIEHISFNAIASSIMQKSMKRVCTLMRQQHASTYKVPSQSVVDSIVVCAQGDIRNALINLHFASLKGAPNMPTMQLEAKPMKSRKRKAQSTLKSIGRDESITMMHALGRIFNPKLTEEKHLQHSPEEIAEAFSTEPRNLINFIHSNYLQHFSDIGHVVSALNDIGIADLMITEYRDDAVGKLGINIAVRSCMVSNAIPVSGWMPVRGPKRFLVQHQATAAEEKLLGMAYAGISRTLYSTDYSSFVRLIANRSQDIKSAETDKP